MIYVLSGGLGKAFAVIDVTYLEGATCTCSNGTHTLEAEDTSGHFMFVIPEAGEWTVSAEKDGTSKSETVDVNESKAYIVNISELMLYYYGNIYEENTGGWASVYNHDEYSGSFTLEETRMNIEVGYHNDRSAFINTPIDLTTYKTLEVEIAWRDISTGYSPYMGVCSAKPGAKPSYLAAKKVTNTAKHIETMDISSVTGVNYIVFSGSNPMNIYVYSVKLLP